MGNKISRVKNHKAFTLIELLVVIAIIGLLASIVLIALNGARQKSRIATRVGDMTEVQTALELYFNDNGAYPNSGGSGNWRGQCAGWTVTTAAQVVWDVNLSQGIVPNYLGTFPTDPSMDAAHNQDCFLYTSNGTDYKLLDYHISDMTTNDLLGELQFRDPPRTNYVGSPCTYNGDGTPVSMSVYTPAAACW